MPTAMTAISTTDAGLVRAVYDALAAALPPSTPDDVVDAAARAVCQAVGRPQLPRRPAVILAAKGCNMRGKPDGAVVGTLTTAAILEAGQDENGWTPVLVRAWVASRMVSE